VRCGSARIEEEKAMAEQAAPGAPQAAPTTAPDTPATLVVERFAVDTVDHQALLHLFSGNQPPVAASLAPDILHALIEALEAAVRQL
jgi:hypothetical protein